MTVFSRSLILILPLCGLASFASAESPPPPGRIVIGEIMVADPGAGWKAGPETVQYAPQEDRPPLRGCLQPPSEDKTRRFDNAQLGAFIRVIVMPVDANAGARALQDCGKALPRGAIERCRKKPGGDVIVRRSYRDGDGRSTFVFYFPAPRRMPTSEWEIAVHARWPFKNEKAASAALERLLDSISFRHPL